MNLITLFVMYTKFFFKLGLSKFVKAYLHYCSDYKMLKKQKGSSEDFIFGKKYPMLVDKYRDAGFAKGGYFHQDLLVARRVFENNPNIHIDVGSRMDGFVAHVASFRKIKFVDIRPLVSTVKNISFIQQNFMTELPGDMIECCDSLSSLNVIEHFGLGRYGDPINYNGHLIGLENLHKMLKKGGTLYFAVPFGEPQRIEFHAHRIFSLKYLLKQFEGKYNLKHFSYVDDYGDLFENVDITEKDIGNNFGVKGSGLDGVAIFELIKN